MSRIGNHESVYSIPWIQNCFIAKFKTWLGRKLKIFEYTPIHLDKLARKDYHGCNSNDLEEIIQALQ